MVEDGRAGLSAAFHIDDDLAINALKLCRHLEIFPEILTHVGIVDQEKGFDVFSFKEATVIVMFLICKNLLHVSMGIG